MKKKNLSNQLSVKISIVVIIACSAATNCSANPKNVASCNGSVLPKDSIVCQSVGDSIYAIFIEAKKVKAQIINFGNDSTSQEEMVKVKSNLIPLVQFVLTDPTIYQSDTPVFGTFMPSFTLTFTQKKASCMAKFDFGLRKWSVCDCDGNILKVFDLSSNDMLRLAVLLFPNNAYLQSL